MVLVPGSVLAWKRFGEQWSGGAVLSPDPSPFASWLAVRARWGSLSHLRFLAPVPARGTNLQSQT